MRGPRRATFRYPARRSLILAEIDRFVSSRSALRASAAGCPVARRARRGRLRGLLLRALRLALHVAGILGCFLFRGPWCRLCGPLRRRILLQLVETLADACSPSTGVVQARVAAGRGGVPAPLLAQLRGRLWRRFVPVLLEELSSSGLVRFLGRATAEDRRAARLRSRLLNVVEVATPAVGSCPLERGCTALLEA